MSLGNLFRLFAAALGLLGAVNIVLIVLADPISRYSPLTLHPTMTLLEAIALFGVGAGIHALTGWTARKPH